MLLNWGLAPFEQLERRGLVREAASHRTAEDVRSSLNRFRAGVDRGRRNDTSSEGEDA